MQNVASKITAEYKALSFDVKPKYARDEISATLGNFSLNCVPNNGLSTGAAKDLEVATRIAKNMLTNYGMDDEFGLVVVSNDEAIKGGLAELIHNKVNSILKSQMAQAIEIIEANIGVVGDLVEALLCRNSLTRRECTYRIVYRNLSDIQFAMLDKIIKLVSAQTIATDDLIGIIL